MACLAAAMLLAAAPLASWPDILMHSNGILPGWCSRVQGIIIRQILANLRLYDALK